MNSDSSQTSAWADVLNDPDVREVGGENTNEGVDFARYWAMSLLLQFEERGLEDYALVFEYLQDVAYFDSSVSPTAATLYQVKKKARGHWTRTALCKRSEAVDCDGADPSSHDADAAKKKPKAKKLAAQSPLGKLHLCVEKLTPVAPTHGVFVSNAPYDLKSANGSIVPQYARHCVSDLCTDDATYISSKIKKELAKVTPPNLKTLHVEQSRINPETMRETLRGQLDKYLHSQYPTLPSVSGRLQESLLQAFSTCSGKKPPLKSIEEIVAQKGFSRIQFSELIESLASARAFSTALDEAVASIKAEGWPSRKCDHINRVALRLQVRFMRHPETKDAMAWDTAIDAAKAHKGIDTYSQAIDAIKGTYKQHWSSGPMPDDLDVTAIALLALLHVDEEP
ncbi:MAG TPA: dsDNA nuclease domain-containing protein [Usitatibacter sp.]|jgi:hypothetical protein|nr:dsDNA nuclease domain-containing protein [Usitatibacter sp.]